MDAGLCHHRSGAGSGLLCGGQEHRMNIWLIGIANIKTEKKSCKMNDHFTALVCYKEIESYQMSKLPVTSLLTT